MSVKSIQDPSSTKFLHPSFSQKNKETLQVQANERMERQPLTGIASQAFLPMEQVNPNEMSKIRGKYTKPPSKITPSKINRGHFNSFILKPRIQTDLQEMPKFDDLSLETIEEYNQESACITSEQIDLIAKDVFLPTLLPYANSGFPNDDEMFNAPLISKEQLKLICKLVNEQILNPNCSTVTPRTETGRFINIQKSKLKEHEVYKSLPFKIQAYIFSDNSVSLYITPSGKPSMGGVCKFSKVFFVDFSPSDPIPLCKWVGRLTNRPGFLKEMQLDANYRCKLEKNPYAATYEHGSYDPYIGKNGKEKFMYLSELCRRGGLFDMIDIIRKNGSYPRIFSDLIKSVHSLHSRGIVHGDIKSRNFFVGDSTILIGDYGIRKSSDGEPDIRFTSETNCPEWFENKQMFDKSILKCPIDIWTLGLTFHEIYMKTKPKWCLLSYCYASFRALFNLPLNVNNAKPPAKYYHLIDEKKIRFIAQIGSFDKTLVAWPITNIASLGFKSINELKGNEFTDKEFHEFIDKLIVFQRELFNLWKNFPLSKGEPLPRAIFNFTKRLENKLRECFKVLAEQPQSPVYYESLIQRMLNPDPRRRITINEIYEEALPVFQEMDKQRNLPGNLSLPNGE